MSRSLNGEIFEATRSEYPSDVKRIHRAVQGEIDGPEDTTCLNTAPKAFLMGCAAFAATL
ncbi:MAG: hypothetical protein O2U62_02530 [Candidatus Bathyarchaeota archaeon]|nr:hypothetical protein [Candidatus Bathyarchaeota archaeon]